MRHTLCLIAFAFALVACVHADEGVVAVDGAHRFLTIQYGADDPKRLMWEIEEKPEGRMVHIRYHLLQERAEFKNGISQHVRGSPCEELAPLTSLSEVGEQNIREAVSYAARLWSRHAEIVFEEVWSKEEADLLIGAETYPQGIAYTDLTVGGVSLHSPFVKIESSVICLNPEVLWTMRPSTVEREANLVYTLVHEFGHVLGVGHPAEGPTRMGFKYPNVWRWIGSEITLEESDVQELRALYGPPPHFTPLEAGIGPR